MVSQTPENEYETEEYAVYDAVIEEFRKAFGDAYVEIKVGAKIII